MRFLKSSVVLPAFLVLLSYPSLFQAAEVEKSILGRLIFENGDFPCDRCAVTLLANGVRPVATAVADLSGHFIFNHIPGGSYTIHLELEGFETVDEPINTFEAAFGPETVITLNRKSAAAPKSDAVVNVSEFLERYPKKAVSLFEKGADSLKRKKNSEAEKYFEQAVELAPTFYEAHNQLGIV